MTFFKEKIVWIGVVAALLILMIFGLAMMGSVLGAKPKALPVALVVEDRPVDMPAGGQLAVGEMVKGKLSELKQLPVKWIHVGSEKEAQAGLDRQQYYGALVLPQDLSAGVVSIQGGLPKPATVKIYLNEGMNAQAGSAVKAILQQVSGTIGAELSGQLLKQIGQQTPQIPVTVAGALLHPFMTEEVTVHPVGTNNAGGGAPNMLTQIIWMGSLVLSVCLYFASNAMWTRTAVRGSGKWGIILAQIVTGVLMTAATAGFLVWMASSWYGMQLKDASAVWLFLWMAGSAFFLLQSALFNWLGMAAAAILVLLLFFSMPATLDWLYSWTPFRYVASGLRNLLYFGESDGMSESYRVIWWLGGVSLVVMLAAAFRVKRPSAADVATAK